MAVDKMYGDLALVPDEWYFGPASNLPELTPVDAARIHMARAVVHGEINFQPVFDGEAEVGGTVVRLTDAGVEAVDRDVFISDVLAADFSSPEFEGSQDTLRAQIEIGLSSGWSLLQRGKEGFNEVQETAGGIVDLDDFGPNPHPYDQNHE